MIDDVEERLRAYGSTIDAATAADRARRAVRPDASSSPRHRRPRRLIATFVVLGIAGLTALGVAVGSSRTGTDRVHVADTTPSSTSPVGSVPAVSAPTSTTYQCSTTGGDTPSCPEEGPPLTAQQKAQFAQWRSEYDPAEVAYVTKGNPAADDVSVVETLEFRVGCRTTYLALQAAEQAAPDQRAAVVDRIMAPTLAIIQQRNWPPQSQQPQIFEHFSNLLENGDFAAVSSQVHVGPGSGDCEDALSNRW